MPFINRCGDVPKFQEKTAASLSTQQTITPDEGYDGLSKVTVNAPIYQTKTITENGIVAPDAGYAGLTSVTINTPYNAYFTYTVATSEFKRTMSFDIGDYWDLHGCGPSRIILYLSQFGCPQHLNPQTHTSDLIKFDASACVTDTNGVIRACLYSAYLSKFDNTGYIGYLYACRTAARIIDSDGDTATDTTYRLMTKVTADDANKVGVIYDSVDKKITIDLTLDNSSLNSYYFNRDGKTSEGEPSYQGVYYAMFIWDNSGGVID